MPASAPWWWAAATPGAPEPVGRTPRPPGPGRPDTRPGDLADAAAAPPSAPAPDAALALARRLIERGEDGQVLRLLGPLAERHSAASVLGAELRLLQATALMGQGRSEEAAACCRSLRACVEPELRARAREIQEVLEAPALERPRDWSLELPELGRGTTLESLGAARGLARSRRPGPEPPPPPPVGPTRAPYGFAALAGVLLLLVLLASLIGGCMEVRTDLRFAGPGRLQLSHHLRSASGTPGPWQRRFGETLARGRGFTVHAAGPDTVLSTRVLPVEGALAALEASLREAALLGGVSLPPPRFEVRERNWLVGVRQRVWLELDLRELPPLPGLSLTIGLEPLRPRAVQRAEPLPLERSGPDRLLWPLQSGAANALLLHCWRWSPLGLGAVAIALLLPLVLLLQRLRRQLGFGLPELPA